MYQDLELGLVLGLIWEPHLSLDRVSSLCLVLVNQLWSLSVHLTAADHLIFSPTCPSLEVFAAEFHNT